MSNLKSYVTPGLGAFAREKLHYVQAIRVGNTIRCAGQGGWDTGDNEVNHATLPSMIKKDLGEEVDQTFVNIDRLLRHAGGKGFSQVYKVVTYCTDIDAAEEHIVRNLKKWFPDHAPIWTTLGVTSLALTAMHIEIDVEAYDEEGAGKAK